MGNNSNNPDTQIDSKNRIDNFSSKEKQQIHEETQAGIDNLRQSTIDYSLSTTSAKSNLNIEKTGIEYEKDIHSLVGFLSVIDKLLEEIKDTKKGISKRGLSKAGKKTMKEAKFKLEQYEKQLKNKKKALLKQERAKIYDNDIANLKNSGQQINRIREEIGIAQWGEYANIANYLYNSPEIARKSNKHQAKNLKFNQKFQEELKTGAISTIFNGNIQKTNDFFRRIAQGEYTEADYQIYERNSTILNPYFQRYEIPIPTNPRGTTGGVQNSPRIENSPRIVSNTPDYKNMSLGETLKQGGIAGALDKVLSNFNNLTPGQRETWKNLGVLACVAGSIFGLYKFYTNKNMSLWKKAGITAGAIFGTEALLGETPLSLFNKAMTGGLSLEELQNKFGNAISWTGFWDSSSSESVGGTIQTTQTTGETAPETAIPAVFSSMMIFNSNTKKSDIDKMTKTFINDKNNENRKIFYEQSCDKLKKQYGEQTMKYFQNYFSDKFDKDRWEIRLASFGVTENTNQNESIHGLANTAIMNEVVLKKFKEENGLTVTNKTELQKYIDSKKTNNQAIDVDELNKHINENGKDRFKVDVTKTHTERREDIENKEKLKNQVNNLSLDNTIKSELGQALEKFYDERTIESKPDLTDFSLKMEGKFLILTSHGGYKSKIDLNKKELIGFGDKKNPIYFTNLTDLLNTADLTNKILETQKGKTPKDMPPFKYKIEKKGIYFNDANSIRKDIITRNYSGMDTRVLSTGRRGATSKIETLYENPEAYANYLSKRREEDNPKK